MHGAGGGGPEGQRNGSWRHGAYSREFREHVNAANLLHRFFSDSLSQEQT
jgi:hypothetical protein